LSRNRDRLGVPDTTPEPTDPPPQVFNENTNESGGFSFVVPTEFVEIPSKGKYYPDNHPLANQETIEIKQMTAKEEDMLTSRTLLRKGLALDRVMQSLIVDKRINPNSLLVGDRNAILIAARISGYGPDYSTNITCPSCGTAQTHTFDLIDASQVRNSDTGTSNIVDNGDGTFTTTLPITKVEVSFRLLTGTDEKNLLQQIENARKSKKEENTITRQLKQFVISVNGDTSQETINYLVNNVPSSDSRYLRNLFVQVTPDINLMENFECTECGYETDMEVPLTADFFWPDR
tara:strand:+ start:765 stop:1634 length:870 start_codon:yes stop_codon:yes gene_type:complete